MSGKLPTVSIVMPTLNSTRTLENCLRSIREQDYPQEKIEVLMVDGGSTDNSRELAEKYKCRFIDGGYKDNQEPRKGVGLLEAAGELVAYIDSDNILPNKKWFQQMVQPFLDDDAIVCSQTIRYGLKEDFPLFSRYCALLGANDPVAYFLGKSEKISWLEEKWTQTPILDETKDYYVVDFDEFTLPTVGGNGFFAKRDVLLKSRCQPDEFFHVDVVLDIVRKGYTRFALVKNEILHDTAASLWKLIARRRVYFMTHNPAHSDRRYLVFDPRRTKDVLRLALYILYTLTLVGPIIFSVRGYLKKPDIAWLFHPIVCLGFLWAYGTATIATQWNRLTGAYQKH